MRNNAIFQYTVVSFLATFIIAVVLVLVMSSRVQVQLIASRGDFYKEYIAAIPENYREVLPNFGVSGIEKDNGPDNELHGTESLYDEWEHFSSDLSQYPYIQAVRFFDNHGETVWVYPEEDFLVLPGSFIPGKIIDNESVRYTILSKNPNLIVNYYIPVIFDNTEIGTAEIQIQDNNLQDNIGESRTRFAVMIFLSGFVFYISLFLLFYKVYLNQKKAISHLDESQTLTIRTMSMLAELKDNDTGEHIQRTSEYCRLLAQSLAEDPFFRKYITEDYIKDLVRSAPLHDIGKVGIPEAILLKPGKLTDSEFEIMKTHTGLGAQVLSTAAESLEFRSFFEIGYQIVLHHHENWDGSGYPHGLKGRDIPLSARIMSIADVYDALTTERPYKRAFSHDEAMEIILKEKGRKFDPKLIENLLRVEGEFRQISERSY